MLLRILPIATLVAVAVAQESGEEIFGACAEKCFTGLHEFPVLINFMSTTVSDHFLNFEAMCSKKPELDSCLQKCDSSKGPFHSEYLDYVCAQSHISELKLHQKCITEHEEDRQAICDTECAGNIDDLRKKLQAHASADDICSMKKCHLRCYAETSRRLCHSNDADIIQFTKLWLKNTLEAIGKDMATASENKAHLCDFFTDPNLLFTGDVQHGAEFTENSSNQIKSSLAIFSILFGVILARRLH